MHRKICYLILAGLVLASPASAAGQKPSPGKPMRLRSGAVNVPPNVTLEWERSRGAAKYDVYFGESPRLAHKLRQEETTYTPSTRWGRTYLWRIDAIDKGGATISQGDVRDFTTRANYEVLENFETYRNGRGARRAISQSWTVVDPDNGRSTAVNAERKIVFAGKQSMRLSYDNTGGAKASVVEHAIPARFRNLRQDGRDSLILFVRGSKENVPAPLYIGLRDEAGTRPPAFSPRPLDPRVVATPRWTAWRIPLREFGQDVNVEDVRKMYISVGDPKGMSFLANSEPIARNLVPSPGPNGEVYIDHIISAGASFGVLMATVEKSNGTPIVDAKVTLELQPPASGSFPGDSLNDGSYVVLAIQGLTYGVTVTVTGSPPVKGSVQLLEVVNSEDLTVP